MTLHHGDCLDVMAAMEPESVDAIVTDPPYNLTADTAGWRGKTGDDFNGRPDLALRGGGFMNKAWDGTGIAFRRETWEAAYRVAKPSAYLLAFGGTRTVHRMTVALEDAGWIIRDMLVWAYASGFPKSKASLKPAWEPIVMARKPGPLRMLDIDRCRIPMSADDAATIDAKHAGMDIEAYERPAGTSLQLSTDPMPLKAAAAHELGRWPANVILTDSIFDGGVEGVVGGGESPTWTGARRRASTVPSVAYGFDPREHAVGDVDGYGDSGTYSRFFLIPKADRADREPVLGGLPERHVKSYSGAEISGRSLVDGEWVNTDNGRRDRTNVHPTVKPVDLMRHLVRLVTPPQGVVLDPFLGSGTTAIAAEMEGFAWIGIEREAEYVAIAEARLNGTQRGLGLDIPAPTPRMPNTHPDLSKHQPKHRAPGDNYSGSWAGTPPTDEDVA